MKKIALLALVVVAIPLSACGGDDGDPQAYCDKVTEFEATGEQGTAAQGRELLAVAPAEIKGDIQIITDALEEFEETGDSSALESDEVAEAGQNTEEWEDDNC